MIDPKLDAPIARGRTAEIYGRGDRHVLKLFMAGRPAGDVRYEATIAHAVQSSGLPVPAVEAVVELGGRYGIIYERVTGRSLLQVMSSRPWQLWRAARLLARLQVAMHDQRVTRLPSQRDRMRRRLTSVQLLDEPTRQRLLAHVEAMPAGERLCHGDFHPDNILITDRGPVVIDWNDATRGVPAADVARTTLLLRDSALPQGMSMAWLIRLVRGLFYRAYRRHYRRLRPQVAREAALWEPIVAAVRLSEGVTEENERLLKRARSISDT